ncbi:MAG TPA: protein-L-isoaspartate(D-aspartate) O-methyltransferase [Vicinamibacterales bacterium]|nr:protein-L-isoaspartate(D-aspartate) O-methyltransferase [Vicinamibacterales bacterium]
MDDAAARHRMVEEQIVSRGIHDARVLDALRSVPRHAFVPDAMKDEAYEDRPLPIGEGQTISQPYMVAAMSALLEPRETDRVLEVGTGSGYQTAILARLAAEVVSIERHVSLAEAAAARCAALGLTNVRVIVGDGTEGAPDRAPFDRILVTAGAPAVPETLKAQLAEGGRLVIPVGPPGFQRLTALDLRDGRFAETTGEGCVFVPLIGRHGWSVDR